MRSSTKNTGGSYEPSGLSKEDEIIPEILFIQFLIRLASPVEKRVDIAFVGVIGLRTEPCVDGYILHELISAIYVSAPDKSSGHREQHIRIEYNGIGFIPIHELMEKQTA